MHRPKILTGQHGPRSHAFVTQQKFLNATTHKRAAAAKGQASMGFSQYALMTVLRYHFDEVSIIPTQIGKWDGAFIPIQCMWPSICPFCTDYRVPKNVYMNCT
jgi:hypothetical protein